MKFQSQYWHHVLLSSALLCQAAGCGESRLITSIRDGKVQLSEQLLANGADVNARGSSGETALHAAIKAGNHDIYTKLLTKGADPNICDAQGTSVVHLAAERNDVFWLQEALKHGGNPNQPNTGNRNSPNSTPIFYAIGARQQRNIVELIDAGADVNHSTQNGRMPLREAMGNGLYDAMIKLIEAGADPRLGEFDDSILNGSWFDDGKENQIDSEEEKRSYRALKSLLVQKGYLPGEKQKQE